MKICVSVRSKVVVWKDYVEIVMNDENDWDHNVEVDAVDLVDCVSRAEVLQTLNEMKIGNTPGPLEVSLLFS